MTLIKDYIDPDKQYINGPVNIIRLEGKIGKVNKVIYLFLDYHLNVADQSQCSNIFSQDVQKFFTKEFYNLSKSNNKKHYDFFLEIYPKEIASAVDRTHDYYEDKDIYIEEVVKVFEKIFNYDKKNKKVMVNTLFKNVRLHYLDIRNYFIRDLELTDEITNMAHSLMTSNTNLAKKITNIIYMLVKLRNNFEHITDILSTTHTSTQKVEIIKNDTTHTDYDNRALIYLVNKLKNKYNYLNVKKVMLKLIKKSISNFTNSIDAINKAIDKFDNYVKLIRESADSLIKDKNTSYLYVYDLSNYTQREIIVDVVNTTCMIAEEKFTEFFARFTDIFFLRRFLDKDYITNTIVYSGAMHSNTYIHTLINEFNFKITNASYSRYTNMDKLNKEIKKKSLVEIQPLILPPSLVQCSTFDGFPENFE